MVCILCDSKTNITNSRFVRKSGYTWRRHTCPRCFAVYTTREYIEMSLSYRLKHSSGTLEPLERDIVFSMIKDSLNHRNSAIADASALTDTILGMVYANKKLVVPYRDFFEITASTLRRFDRVAYIKFTSLHNHN